MSQAGIPTKSLDTLQASISRSTTNYDWPRVLDLTTQILERPDLPPETAVDTLRHRAAAFEHMGQVDDAIADLESAVSWAKGASLTRRQIEALNQLAFLQVAISNDPEDARKTAAAALNLAEQEDAVDLAAEALVNLAQTQYSAEDIGRLQELGQRALSLAQQSGSLMAEAGSYVCLAQAAARREDFERTAAELFQRALIIYNQIGQRSMMIWVHGHIAFEGSDSCDRTRYHNEQILLLAHEINHVIGQFHGANGLATVFSQLGLYHRATEVAEEALHVARSTNAGTMHWYLLTTLVECHLALGRYKPIPTLLFEMQALTTNEDITPFFVAFLSGLAAYGSGNFKGAVAHFQTAIAHFPKSKPRGYRGNALAWLAAAELADGNVGSSYKHAAEAVSLCDGSPVLTTEQEIYWWHYQAALSMAMQKGEHACTERRRSKATPLADDQFEILNNCRRLMMDFIARISDEGLRRNYLNKVAINRDITLEWAQQAVLRGESLAPFTKRETSSTSFEKQFQRLVETGNRLTAQRDPNALPETIRNEFVELCGAERAVVALRAADGTLNWAATLGLGPEQKIEDTQYIEKYLAEASVLREPLLRDSEGTVPEDELPELHLRSVVALPLVSQGKLWGVLYGDMRHIFGRFSEQDLALLNLLANQAAAALENANWVQGLEQQVAERTAELQTANSSLEERNAELAIINSIQAGLVAADRFAGDLRPSG